MLNEQKGILDDETRLEIQLMNEYLKLAVDDMSKFKKDKNSNFLLGAKLILNEILPYFIETVQQSSKDGLIEMYTEKIIETIEYLDKRIKSMEELGKYNKQPVDYNVL